jgi:hypothetical protein
MMTIFSAETEEKRSIFLQTFEKLVSFLEQCAILFCNIIILLAATFRNVEVYAS